MKKTTLLLAIALMSVLVSCAPTTYLLPLQARHPSKSGNDLGMKTMAVVYLYEGKDSLMNKTIAESFTEALEADYFDGDDQIALYRMQKVADGNYSAKDTLVNLVLDSGQDVVFLFDTPVYGDMTVNGRTNADVKLPLNMRMYMYDSMDKADTVKTYRGRTVLRQRMNVPEDYTDVQAEAFVWANARPAYVGSNAAANFLPVWKDEAYLYYTVPGSGKWDKAADYFSGFNFRDAMKVWMEICENSKGDRRAMAEYNIAVACHILGKDDLAAKWLDRSELVLKTKQSGELRTKIQASGK
ncbi:MAG: DUF6340 family protein [Bacteroidota bacterium]|nr:DUF6340 family protein [Bacteroidota bacterium]